MSKKRFLIVGNPNTGKTSLFNNLTKAREKVANYSGVTVKEKSQTVKINDKVLEFVDLPGVYSLASKSDDEVVTQKYLGDNKSDPIIYVCSSGEIKKNLILLTDLIKENRELAVIVNKTDKGLDSKLVDRLQKELGVPIIQQDVRKNRDELLEWVAEVVVTKVDKKLNLEKLLAFFPTDSKTLDRLDRFILHPVFGKILVFIVLVLVLIISYGKVGTSISHIVERSVDKFGDWLLLKLSGLGLGVINDFISDVIIGAVGEVVVYLPQLALMLSLLFLLEEVGYLPRVASLFNFPLQRVGMNGKSVFSLVMGFGCTTSAVLTTRNIGSISERRTTARFLPFIGCSAKLPILLLISQMMLGGKSLILVCLVYLVSALIGLWYVTLKQKNNEKCYILELPKLKKPSVVRAVKQSLVIVLDLFKKICITVFVSTTLLWILLRFTPNLTLATENNSILEIIANFVSVIFYPLGLNDSKVVIALVSGLLAKENIVSTLGLMGGLSELTAIKSVTLLIFIMLYSPCVPALHCVGCEFGKREAVKMFFANTLIAYVSAFVFSTFARVNLFLGFIMLIIIALLFIVLNLNKNSLKTERKMSKCRIKT